MKCFRNIIFGIIILLLLSLPIVIYMANGGASDTILTIMYICFNVITILLIIVFYCFIVKNNYNLIVLPIVFMISPIIFYYELSSMRLFFDIMSCPAGWEIIVIGPTMLYSLPFFVITCIISLIKFIKIKKKANIN